MITTEILAAYAAYGLKIKILNYKCDYVGIEYTTMEGFYLMDGKPYVTYKGGSVGKGDGDWLPILRPLSELKGKHHHLGLLDTDYAKLANYLYDANFSLPLLDVISYNATRELLKHHYNVFNLPEGQYVKKV